MIDELRALANVLEKHTGVLGSGAQLVRRAADEIKESEIRNNQVRAERDF